MHRISLLPGDAMMLRSLAEHVSLAERSPLEEEQQRHRDHISRLLRLTERDNTKHVVRDAARIITGQMTQSANPAVTRMAMTFRANANRRPPNSVVREIRLLRRLQGRKLRQERVE